MIPCGLWGSPAEARGRQRLLLAPHRIPNVTQQSECLRKRVRLTRATAGVPELFKPPPYFGPGHGNTTNGAKRPSDGGLSVNDWSDLRRRESVGSSPRPNPSGRLKRFAPTSQPFARAKPRSTIPSVRRDFSSGLTGHSARQIESSPVWQLQNSSRRRLRHANGGLYWEAPADRAMAC